MHANLAGIQNFRHFNSVSPLALGKSFLIPLWWHAQTGSHNSRLYSEGAWESDMPLA